MTIRTESGLLIAKINKGMGDYQENARLIAASPELLLALKELWAVTSHHAGRRIQELVESAINKAEQK